jgi:hypothetical protein
MLIAVVVAAGAAGADAYLNNATGDLTAQTRSSMSALTLTSYLSLHNESLATLTFDFPGSAFGTLQVHVYSFDSAPTTLPPDR